MTRFISSFSFKIVKQYGNWRNTGACKPIGPDSTCGLGLQTQTRACINGTTDICTDADTKQNVSCADAGTSLDVCKQLGNWVNLGGCIANGTDSSCGPGLQTQTRTCTDGTTDKCNDFETKQNISCSNAGTTLPSCRKRNLIFLIY